jgi:hypothetical protein
VEKMISYIIVSIVSGILFGVMDGIINANSFARRLYNVYKPIAKTSMNIPAGIVIDLIYGFIMAGIFMILYNSLPGEIGVMKGISYAFLAWFFRVVMHTASQFMMFKVPIRIHLYTLVAGLGEMLLLGILYGVTLTPEV